MPGMKPAENRAPTERLRLLAIRIMMMLGGMMPPMVELTAVSAAAKGPL